MLFLRGYGDSAYAADAKTLLAEVMEKELAKEQTQTASASSGPTPAEQKLFEAAQANPSRGAWEAYLQIYPNGVFTEFARQELNALRAQNGEDPVGPGQHAGPKAGTADASIPPGIITFESPLDSEVESVNGKSIAELIGTTPLFPPVEGLPDEYWKNQHCSNCHEWTRERICTQANTYLSLNMQRSLDKAHPFGGVLKRSLKAWAAGGCQ